ncbi:type I restriction endonuclease subunit S [Paenibacillus cisolokensis]|uniref:Type I restriction endonuclease subunit S n=1 Tax=Paenibacillus cisolokensis TaxID=1658519 RepID=A0ABQ4N4K7_9BACL|nr:restriction endonuclease subunit S [Paenibacillus cisolokensis]GIQ63120.1 type I restriction endonuclease subunit S [Paenibacillus cisolokensis]
MAKRKKKQELSPEELLEQALVPEDEQPYEVPENWVWTRLGNVTTIVGGGTPSSNVKEYYEDGHIPWITPADLSGYTEKYIAAGRKNITDLGLKYSSARLMPKGTVLLSSRAPIGYVAIAANELCTNQGFKNFLPSEAFLPDYLYWYLFLNKDLLESYASGTTFLELSGSKVGLVEFPLAPLAEQQRIVDRIESLFAKLDQAKELVENALDSFETRKAAFLHKAFTGELTVKWRKNNPNVVNTVLEDVAKFANKLSKKDRENILEGQALAKLSSIPSWYNSTIGAIGIVTNGSTPSRKIHEYWNGEIPWVSSGEVRNNVIRSTTEKITRLGYENSSVKLLPAGTVLIAMIGEGKTRGQSAVLEIEATTNQNVAAIIIDHGFVCPRFLWYWLQKEYQKNREKGNGTGPQALNCQRVRELEFVIPPFLEQQEIVRILDSIFEKEREINELVSVISKIDLIKKSILSRAFRGELCTNDETDEPALELLKRVVVNH